MGYRVIIAALLGALAGICFGPRVELLKPIGQAYTMLLQTAALPYVCFSLVHGLGSLTPSVGKKLWYASRIYFGALWLITAFLVFCLIQLIPDTYAPLITAGKSSGLVSNFSESFISYLIPQNFLYDMSNNIVSAIAVFGLILGIALMHLQQKEPFLSTLERVNQMIEKILHWLGTLAPVGAFVYIAIAFGTIYIEDFLTFQLYISAFIITCCLVTFWLLPAAIAALTPLRTREARRAIRYICIVPLLTGFATTALPFLYNYLRELSKSHEAKEHFRTTSQTVLPLAYSFGQIGNAMVLFFIVFLGFYFRHPFTGTEMTLLSILTVPLSVGSSTGNLNSLLFLTKQLGLPKAAGDFFLQIKAVTYNFQVMMSSAAVLTLVLLALYSYYGQIHIQWRKLGTRIALPLVLFATCIFSIKHMLHFGDAYQHLYMNLSMEDVFSKRPQIKPESSPRTFASDLMPNVLKLIKETGTLKVGYNQDAIPFCYRNANNELVGFDISYAYELANDLNCALELVPFEYNNLPEDLAKGNFDIGMSSIIMSESRIVEMDFTFPYFENNNVLIVPIKDKKAFLNLSAVQERNNFTIGAGGAQFQIAKDHFPKAKLVATTKNDPLLNKEVDAILWSETNSTIWCLSNPGFVAISYGTALGKNYFAYPFHRHATDFGFFLNNWLSLKEQSGFNASMQNYWIQGIPIKQRPPRWSLF